MSGIGDLVANLTVNSSQWTAGLKKGEADLKGFVASVSSTLAPVTAALAGAWGAGASLSAARVDLQAMQKLQAVLTATGGAAGLSAKQIGEYASELQLATNFGDELTVGAAAILASFDNLRGENLKTAIALAQDMAVVLGTDLDMAARKLGRSLQSIKPEEVGEKLAALEGRFGGAAAAIADPWTQLQNVIGDVGESIGRALLPPVNALARFATVTLSAWQNGLGKVIVAIGATAVAMKAIVLVQKSIAVGQALILSLAGPIGWAKLAAGAAVFAATLVGINTTLGSINAQAKALPNAVAMGGHGGFDLDALKNAKDEAKTLEERKKAWSDFANSSRSDLLKLGDQLWLLSGLAKELKIPEAQVAFVREGMIDRFTGFSTKLQYVNEEIRIMAGEATKASIELEKMAKAGVAPGKIKELEAAMKRLDNLKFWEKIKEEGKALKDALKTPQEKFADEEARIKRLRDLGGIDEETARRALEKARKDLLGGASETASGAAGALQKGEAETFSAVVKAMRGDGIDAKQLAAEEEQVEIATRQEDLLREIKDNGLGGNLGQWVLPA